MKKQYYAMIAILLGLFSSVSFAATQSFYATGNANSDAPFLIDGTGSNSSKSFSISYTLGSNWIINSAALWLKAVDDNNNGNHCTSFGTAPCTDSSVGSYYDPEEWAAITSIEGNAVTHFGPTAIDAYGWYNLGLDVKASLLDGVFNAIVRPTSSANALTLPADFWYKNARIDIDYSLKPVPVPAAIWLFGSALLGLTGLKRKSIAGTVAA